MHFWEQSCCCSSCASLAGVAGDYGAGADAGERLDAPCCTPPSSAIGPAHRGLSDPGIASESCRSPSTGLRVTFLPSIVSQSPIASVKLYRVSLPTRREHKWTGLTEPIGGYVLVKIADENGWPAGARRLFLKIGAGSLVAILG